MPILQHESEVQSKKCSLDCAHERVASQSRGSANFICIWHGQAALLHTHNCTHRHARHTVSAACHVEHGTARHACCVTLHTGRTSLANMDADW